eukprot:12265926-Alexandrium_andersonii.AAC.1
MSARRAPVVPRACASARRNVCAPWARNSCVLHTSASAERNVSTPCADSCDARSPLSLRPWAGPASAQRRILSLGVRTALAQRQLR